MENPEIKLQIIYDHYKDSFFEMKELIKSRNKLFLWGIGIIVIFIFQIFVPDESSLVISQFVSKKLFFDSCINFSFIQTVMWFVLLGLIIKYYQYIIAIERGYNYIHRLEEIITDDYGIKNFSREGGSYLMNYPLFLKWASLLYTLMFPLAAIIILTIQIFHEFNGYKLFSLVSLNFVAYVLILSSLTIYFVTMLSIKIHKS